MFRYRSYVQGASWRPRCAGVAFRYERQRTLAVGDRVQMHGHPMVRGTVAMIDRWGVHVLWDNEDPEDPADNTCFSDPQRQLQKIARA